MSDLQGLLPLLASSGQPPVTFVQLVQFIAFMSLHNKVLLVQPGSFQLIGHSQPILLPRIQEFISQTCFILLPSVNIIWTFLAQTAWTIDLDIIPARVWTFHQFLLSMGILVGSVRFSCIWWCNETIHADCFIFHSLLFYFPPSHQCMNMSCKRFQQLILMKAESRQAVLSTIDYGAIPVWSIHLICECTLPSSLWLNIHGWHNFFKKAVMWIIITTIVSTKINGSTMMEFLKFCKLVSTNLLSWSLLICGSWWCFFLGHQQQTVPIYTTWVSP